MTNNQPKYIVINGRKWEIKRTIGNIYQIVCDGRTAYLSKNGLSLERIMKNNNDTIVLGRLLPDSGKIHQNQEVYLIRGGKLYHKSVSL